MTAQTLEHPNFPKPIPRVHQHRSGSAGSQKPLWIFLIFAFYGPSLNVIGELRYVEIIVLIALVAGLRQALRSMTAWETVLVTLFLLAAGVQYIADIYNNAPLETTLKRCATYVLMALLLIGTRYMVGRSRRILGLLVIGYCLSYLIVYLFEIPVVSRNYHLLPWRLGLGYAMTLLIGAVIFTTPKLAKFGGIALFAMGLIHFAQSGRALAALTLASAILAEVSWRLGTRHPSPASTLRMIKYAVVAALGIFAAYGVLTTATENRWFSGDTQWKMEAQMNNPAGLLASGRPDTATALYAISRKPLIGYGTGQPDPDVSLFYAVMSTYVWYNEDNYEEMLGAAYSEGFETGIPSHSHLFGLWAEAGIFATGCWFAVIWLCANILLRASLWKNAISPLVIFIALTTLWDVLFSPGPIRMDMAIRLAVMLFAVEAMQQHDLFRLKAKSHRIATAP